MKRPPVPPVRPVVIAAIAIIFLLAAGLFHRFWLTDLSSHGRLHLAVLLFLTALLFLPHRRFAWAILLATGAVGIGVVTLPSAGRSVVAEGRSVYKALHVNLDEHNLNPDGLIELLDAEQPDFVSFCEYTGAWDEAVADLLGERYPHRMIEPRRDLHGLVLLSRYPFESSSIVIVPGTLRPILRVEVRLPEGLLTLLAVHAESPMTAERFASRNRTFVQVTTLVQESSSEAVIALGDFNSTPWSGNFVRLLQQGGLDRPVSSLGLKATWPAWFGPLGIPIDHILLSPELQATDYRIGRGIGSDHLPVVCAFIFAGGPVQQATNQSKSSGRD